MLYAYPNPIIKKNKEIVVFDTITNTFSFRTLTPDKPFIMTSHLHNVRHIPIPKSKTKVDLRPGGVREGEGMVDNVIKRLPKTVVMMRLFGKYEILYVLRNAKLPS